MKLLILAIAMLCSAAAHALPPQAEADMLMIEAKKAQDVRDYAAVVKNLSRVAELNVKLPESFPFHFGKALSETGNYARARAELEKYIAGAGSDGRFYREALEAIARNVSLEAEEKRKRQDDQAAMAKHNQAMEDFRRDFAQFREKFSRRYDECTDARDRCFRSGGDYTGRWEEKDREYKKCERRGELCLERLNKAWPTEPKLPKLNFAESATQFAARPQPTPTPPVSPTPLNAPVPSGGTTVQAAPVQHASPSAPARPATISTALSQDSRLAEKEATYLANFPGLSSRTADQAVASLGLPAEVSRVTSYHLCPGCRLNVVFHCRSGVAIRNHGDFRALKIRVGQISPANQELASLGASPQMMPLTAVGDAFRQGVLDCVAHEELRGDAGISKPLEKQTIDLEISLPHEGRDLTPTARAELDSFVGKLAGLKLQVIMVAAFVHITDTGDSARSRADEVAATVKNYLVGKGVSANLVYAEGKAGEPSPGKASVRVDLQAIGTR